MNRQQVKELLPIIQAFADGKQIEIKTKEGNRWCTLEENDIQYLDFKKCDFRIKSEPKYRPFANVEECWREMQKHQPFGWTKSISEKRFYFISKIDDNGCFFSNNDNVSFKTLFASDTFTDGTPFGIKEDNQ